MANLNNPVNVLYQDSSTGQPVPVTQTTPLPVTSGSGSSAFSITGNPVTPTQKGSTITLGGTAQVAIATNASRRGFWIQNQSAGPLYINSLATAVIDNTSLLIPAGALYEPQDIGVPLGNISIIGATTGQAFAAREW